MFDYPPPRCTCTPQHQPCAACATYRPRHDVALDPVVPPAPVLPGETAVYTISTKRWTCTVYVDRQGRIRRREGRLRPDFQRHLTWRALRTDLRRQLKHATIRREIER